MSAYICYYDGVDYFIHYDAVTELYTLTSLPADHAGLHHPTNHGDFYQLRDAMQTMRTISGAGRSPLTWS